jgi:uncharacterized protein
LIPTFAPRWWLRGRHHQSILPSSPLRRRAVERRTQPLRSTAVEHLLDCGDGVRLQAFHSRPVAAGSGAAPVVVLLHGWEGSADSLYVLSLGQSLLEAGYEVVRLNLRDHGATQHLNEELFHSCRLPEVVGAVRALQQGLAAGRRLALVGFSLGGNFMLRVGAEADAAGLQLERIIAVSPVLDPARTLDALESGWSLYERYFVAKWSRSLALKQAAWPQRYDFAPLVASRNLRLMTRDLVLAHTGYPDLDTYLAGYAITGARLASLDVPTTIITAADDPIIPAADLRRLAYRGEQLRVVLTPHGGHVGFLEALHGPSWVDRYVTQELCRHVPAHGEPATS